MTSLPRRAVLSAALALLSGAYAHALTGVDALDTPSIPVKTPSRVLLIAITQAGARLVAAGEHGVIIYSDDQGQSWTQGSVPVNVTLTCLAFATPLIGWAAGHFGVIMRTEDGGASWAVQLNGIQANQLTLAASQDPNLASNPSPAAPMAVRRAAHFLGDGPDKPFLTMLVFSPQKMIAFGAYRLAMITEDAGKTWADWSLHIYDQYSHNIYDSAAVGNDLYLVGEDGLVFCSTDSGATFQPVTATQDVTLFGILAAHNGSLITYGVAGAAFLSTDGAKTWNPITLASQDDITAGRVLKSGMILLASEGGAVFKSTDNGATFSAIGGITPEPFFDLEQAPGGDLIIVGAGGVTVIPKTILNS